MLQIPFLTNRVVILFLLSITLLRRTKNVHNFISYTKWRNGRPMDNLLETAKMRQLLGTSSPSPLPGLRPWTHWGTSLLETAKVLQLLGELSPDPLLGLRPYPIGDPDFRPSDPLYLPCFPALHAYSLRPCLYYAVLRSVYNMNYFYTRIGSRSR